MDGVTRQSAPLVTASLAGRARYPQGSVPEALREREHGKPVVATAEKQWEEF